MESVFTRGSAKVSVFLGKALNSEQGGKLAEAEKLFNAGLSSACSEENKAICYAELSAFYERHNRAKEAAEFLASAEANRKHFHHHIANGA